MMKLLLVVPGDMTMMIMIAIPLLRRIRTAENPVEHQPESPTSGLRIVRPQPVWRRYECWQLHNATITCEV